MTDKLTISITREKVEKGMLQQYLEIDGILLDLALSSEAIVLAEFTKAFAIFQAEWEKGQ